jgi:ketosteroid isomerase-like protein
MTGTPTDGEELVQAYYESLDTGAYDRLEELLTRGFVHERPEMTLSGRAEFVAFMRDERPRTDTTHPIETVYRTADRTEFAANGRLVADGETITGFVDLFTITDGRIERIETYVD